MHPSRGGKARHARARKTLPTFFDPASLQPADATENVTPVQSPNHASHRTPQTAPQERKSMTSKSRSFTSGSAASDVRKSFSTPSPATSHRKRSRTTEFHDGADEPEGSNKKGGHSLRKRARIDYSFEYVDDELGGRSRAQPRSASRGRRRRTEIDDDLEHESGHGPRRRVMDSWRADTSPRRKNPARKTADQRSYAELADEKDALDTIEVGGRVQSDESPEQAEERKYRDDPASSPSPKEEPERERFVVGIPLPASLRGTLGFPGFTKSPDLIEGPWQKPNETKVEEAMSASPAAEPHQEPVEEKPGQNAPALAPSEPSVDIQSHSPQTDARSVTPRPEEVQPQREEPPSELSAPARTRRNSAPGKFSPASAGPGSYTAPELPSRPWKEFEDLKPEDEAALPLKLTAVEEEEPAEEAEVAEPIETVNDVASRTPEPHVETKPAEPLPIEPEPEPEPEPESGPQPEPEPAEPPPKPEPVQSPKADISAGNKEGYATETPQKTPEPPPPVAQDAVSVEDKLPQGTKVHTITIETDEKTELAEAEPATPAKPWSHLTPHLAGQWTMHPESRLPQLDEARVSFDSKGSATPSSKPSAANVEAVVNGDSAATPQEPEEEAEEPIESVAASPRINVSLVGSPVPELNHATAASSPAAPDEDEAPEEIEEETPEEPPQTQRFYKYPRLRDPDDYSDVIQHFKDLPTEDLYEMCGFVDETLLALQKEYLMLGAIVDDYENIERRRAHDEAYEQLEKRGDKVSRKTFVLKGYRAPMTVDEKETAYQRHQDRVQAAAYGFRYDSHQAKVGKQDPVLQMLRNGSDDGEPRRTLRSDPLRSAKATEAADETPAVPGKRIRRPREVFDPATASRSSTPVPRRRRGRAADAEEDGHAEQNGQPVNGHAPGPAQPEKPRRGRKRRTESDIVPVEDQDAQGGSMLPPPPPKRVRRASTKALQAAEEMANHEHQSVFPIAPMPESVVESVEAPRKNQRIVTLKTKARSFGALAGARLSAESEERPRTASSSHSEGDWQRPKRRRRKDDEEEEEWEEEEEVSPKAKRARKVTKRARESAVDNMLLVPSIQDDRFVEFQPYEAKVKKPRIKVVKSGGDGSSGGTAGIVSPGANGEEPKRKGRKPGMSAAAKAKKLEEAQGELSAQEYAALSKSEKMSHSMKSRWASGSMQQAVDKRKATLAKKKAAKVAAGPVGEGSPERNVEEAQGAQGKVFGTV